MKEGDHGKSTHQVITSLHNYNFKSATAWMSPRCRREVEVGGIGKGEGSRGGVEQAQHIKKWVNKTSTGIKQKHALRMPEDVGKIDKKPDIDTRLHQGVLRAARKLFERQPGERQDTVFSEPSSALI